MDPIAEIAAILGLTEGQVAAHIEDIRAAAEPSTEGGVEIVAADDEIVVPWFATNAPKEQKEKVEKMVEPKAEKVKCKCCGFAKKARRVNAEGICKVCYAALATSEPEAAVVVVGRQGKRGRNTVSVVIGGQRVKVQRKVRLEA